MGVRTGNPPWANEPATTSPLSAAAMQNIEIAIDDIGAEAESVAENVNTATVSGAYALPQPGTATVHDLRLSGNVTITLPAAPAGAVSITVLATQDATGGRTVTWPTNVGWVGGTPPVAASAAGLQTVYALFTLNGGITWVGLLAASGVIPATPPPVITVPAAPGGLAASPDENSIQLSWAAPASGGAPISSYKLYRGTTAGVLSLYQTLGNVFSYDDVVPVGVDYFYAVSAVNIIGEGPLSAEVSARVPVPPVLLAEDNFNRANTSGGPGLMSDGVHTWGGAWASDYNVVSNQLNCENQGEPTTVDYGTGDVAIECKRLGNSWGGGLSIRGYLRVGWRVPSGLMIYDGSSPIAEPSESCPVGSILRVEASGSNIKVKVDGVLVHEFSNSKNLTNGVHGVRGPGNSGPLLDDFKVYEL